MRKSSVAVKVCAELDVSRPVVVLVGGGVREEIVREILATVSPTSRVLVWNGKGRMGEDERREEVVGNGKDLYEGLQKCRATHLDAVIWECRRGEKERSEHILQEIGSVLRSSGQCILIPFYKNLRESVKNIFIDTKERIVWDRYMPMRIFIGRKRE